MMVTNEVLQFANSDRKFLEDNLLDADDWGEDLDLTLQSLDASPSSSNESEQFEDFGYNPQSWLLGYDDMETWLNECSPMEISNSNDHHIIKEEPASPPREGTYGVHVKQPNVGLKRDQVKEKAVPVASKLGTSRQALQVQQINEVIEKPPINLIPPKLIAVKKSVPNNKIKQIQKKTLLDSIKYVKPVSGFPATIPTSNIKGKTLINKNNVIVRNVKTVHSGGSAKKVLPATGKDRSLVPTMPKGNFSPQIVKLENGQYYVAPSLSTANGISKYQVSNSKPILKRPSNIKMENLLAEAKDFAELKNLKRQQRMMKNRESACLSRQRKKQHLMSLEARVAEITEMNQKLKEENDSLKKKIQSLECENKELREQPVNLFKVDTKKSTLLLALLLFFAFQTFFPRTEVPVRKHIDSTLMKPYIYRGRSLLQFDNSNIDNYESLLEEKYRYDIVNDDFNAEKKKEILRSKLKKLDEFRDMSRVGEIDHNCGGHFNQSHLTRINKHLEGLVNGLHKGKKNRKSRILKHLLSNNTTSLKESNCNQTDSKKPHYRHLTTAPYIKFFRSSEKSRKSLPASTLNKINNMKNTSQELASLIQKSIRRKPDTFYVVSLLKDMLILPATNYSSTQRPKVTFMLPAYLPNQNNDTQMNDGDKLPIIQIDCNVLDTKLLRIQRNLLSKHLLTELKS